MLRSVGAAFAVSCFVASSLFAGPLAPGQTANTREEDGIVPMPPASAYQGAVLAERTQPFRFEGVDEEGQALFAEGTFTSRVYRDAGTGGLAFLYRLEQGASNSVKDLERLFINGFGTAATDVYSEYDYFSSVTRSPDGDQLDWFFDQEGIFGTFLVRTPDVGYALHPGGFDVNMDFEPSGNTDSAVLAAYAPVPEPGTAGVLLLGGAMLLRRARGKTTSHAGSCLR